MEKGQGHRRLPVLIRLDEPEKEGLEDKLRTLFQEPVQIPLVWPRASEGTGPRLNVTEARGLHSGGPGLCMPPQAAGGAGGPVLSFGKRRLLRAQGWQDGAKTERAGLGSDGAAHGLGVRGHPRLPFLRLRLA